MAKMTPQCKASAQQIAGIVATTITVRGTLPDAMSGRVIALTAIRLARQFDEVVAMVEKEEDLLTMPYPEALGRMEQLVLALEKTDEAKSASPLESLKSDPTDG